MTRTKGANKVYPITTIEQIRQDIREGKTINQIEKERKVGRRIVTELRNEYIQAQDHQAQPFLQTISTN